MPLNPNYVEKQGDLRTPITGDMLKSDGTPLNIAEEILDLSSASSCLVKKTATGGSTTTVIDTSAVFIVDMFKDYMIEIRKDGTTYYSTIISNTSDTITIEAIAVPVQDGDIYSIKTTVSNSKLYAEEVITRIAKALSAFVDPNNDAHLGTVLAANEGYNAATGSHTIRDFDRNKSFTTDTYSIATKDVAVKVTIPNGVKRMFIGVRDGLASEKLKISEAGTVGVALTNYFEVLQSDGYLDDKMDYDSNEFYIESTVASVVVQIIYSLGDY